MPTAVTSRISKTGKMGGCPTPRLHPPPEDMQVCTKRADYELGLHYPPRGILGDNLSRGLQRVPSRVVLLDDFPPGMSQFS